MTDNNHPITPPYDQVYKWWEKECNLPPSFFYEKLYYVAKRAARWGADQELEACCAWAAEQDRGFDLELRAARRPKPKSRKQRALDALAQMEDQFLSAELATEIRNALEELFDD